MCAIKLRASHPNGTLSFSIGFFDSPDTLQDENMRCGKVAILRQQLYGAFYVRERFFIVFLTHGFIIGALCQRAWQRGSDQRRVARPNR